jgi:two-component system, sensor histidine kinase YesM
MKNKLFLQNLLLFLFPLLIPITILGTLSLMITQHYIQGEMNKATQNVFNQIDRNVESIFNEMNSLKMKFGSPEVLYRLEEILRTQKLTLENLRLMEAVQNDMNVPVYSKPYMQSIYVYVNNDHNQFLASGNGLVKFDMFHDVEWIESFKQNQENTGIWDGA